MAGRFKLMTSVSWVIVALAIAVSGCQTTAVSIGQLFAPSYESQLAEYLTNTGAAMYGAYWCPHCARQKRLFGNAVELLPYVECDARGMNPRVDLCAADGITAYPTWQINGEFYLGALPLKRLAILSGFEEGDQTDIDTDSWGGYSPAQ